MLSGDVFFLDEMYSEISGVLPTVCHFVSVLYNKWAEIGEEYPELRGIHPPARCTVLGLGGLADELEFLKAMQERGLLYASLTGQITGHAVTMMLHNHGYTEKKEIEHSGNPERPVLASLGDVLADSAKSGE